MSNGVAHNGLILFDCPRVRKSEYWQFIKLVAPSGAPPNGQTHWLSQDASDAYCLRCDKMFRFTKGSSNSVRRHMERFHRKELLKRQQQIAEARRGGSSPLAVVGKRSLATRPLASGADSRASSMTPTSQTSTKRLRVESDHMERQRHAPELLLKWFASNLRPLTIAQDPGLADFVRFCCADEAANFTLPSVDTLRHRLELWCESIRFDARQKVKKDIGRFALSIEMWRFDPSTTTSASESYAVVKCWHLSDDFVLQSVALDVIPMVQFVVENFKSQLVDLLIDFSLPISGLSLCLVPDTVSVSQADGPSGEILLVGDAASSLDDIAIAVLAWTSPGASHAEAIEKSEIVGALKAVQHHLHQLRGSGSKWQTLAQVFPFVNDIVDQDTVTSGKSSWTITSATDTLTRMAQLRPVLMGPEADGGTPSLACEQLCRATWFILEGWLALCRPLNEVLSVLRRERFASVAFVLPMVMVMRQVYNREDLVDDVKARLGGITGDGERIEQVRVMLHATRQELVQRLDGAFQGLISRLAWVTALDPRYGRLRHLSEAEREACKDTLIDRAVALYVSQLPSPSTEALDGLTTHAFDAGTAVDVDARNPGHGLMHRLLYDDDEDVASADVLSRDADIAHARLCVANEVMTYLAEQQASKGRVLCPLQWWGLNRERFPFLRAARAHLAEHSAHSALRARVLAASRPGRRRVPQQDGGTTAAAAGAFAAGVNDNIHHNPTIKRLNMSKTDYFA
ncbi:hypothetical protein PINS_up016532 [Pythium insidiosum]|nr:hypothetical protein PINS_up016532 [Pythium insidiosum]